MNTDKIRNFCIIAHIDHGKSTLADRMLEITGTVTKREMKSQLLDSMELEREKGITIKLTPVCMSYKGYTLNLIDTPGHVDFSYEVSRSLQAVEGAILVVDATQGIQAQTLANVYLALEQDLTIIPVINKIDLPASDVPRVSAEIINLLGCSEDEIIKVSAKTGEHVDEVLDAIIDRIPAPRHSAGETKEVAEKNSDSMRALIFDSYFDDYRGVILYIRMFSGTLSKNANIHMMATGSNDIALEVGILNPKMSPRDELKAGEIGYIVTNLKATREAKVGDTVTLTKNPTKLALPGYKNVHPFVYAGFFPVSNDQYNDLKEALEKLALSDSALQYEPENSPVLGFGLRIGFLGLLHMDIIRERLEREFKLDLIVTNPSTDYRVTMTSGEELDIRSASSLPDATKILEIREPWVKGEIITPKEYIGAILDLIITKRGRQKNISYIDTRAIINFEAPMANLLTDFYDQLKSSTSGYASFNYELAGYQAEDLVRVDFLVAGERVDALSVMAHRSEADAIGRTVTKKLKEVIPQQMFEIPIQAAIGNKVIARETIRALRKDVLAKCYGGDITRKKKLLEKQKEGKKKMRQFGTVEVPAEAFMAVLKFE